MGLECASWLANKLNGHFNGLTKTNSFTTKTNIKSITDRTVIQ